MIPKSSGLEFISKVKEINYEEIKQINPEWSGLVTSITKKAQNIITGETKEIVEVVKLVDKYQFIDELIKSVQELNDEIKKLKNDNAAMFAQITEQNTKISNLESIITNANKVHEDTTFLLKERLDKIIDGGWNVVAADLTSSRLV